jgi:anti-anti-sigma factor
VQIANDENGGVVRIEGTLGIGEVAELRETLCHALAQTSNLVLDLSAVDSCDTAALQLLYSAHKTADSARHRQFAGLSGAIAAAAAALGLEIGELTAEDAVRSAAANEATTSGI